MHGIALLSGAGGGAGDAVRDEEGGAAACVAAHSVRCIDRELVRAHLQDRLPAHLQEPPAMGIPPQTPRHKQVPTAAITTVTFYYHNSKLIPDRL